MLNYAGMPRITENDFKKGVIVRESIFLKGNDNVIKIIVLYDKKHFTTLINGHIFNTFKTKDVCIDKFQIESLMLMFSKLFMLFDFVEEMTIN